MKKYKLLSIFVLTLIFNLFLKNTLMAEITAKLTTTKGDIVLELTPDKTPITVANFVNLIQRGF